MWTEVCCTFGRSKHDYRYTGRFSAETQITAVFERFHLDLNYLNLHPRKILCGNWVKTQNLVATTWKRACTSLHGGVQMHRKSTSLEVFVRFQNVWPRTTLPKLTSTAQIKNKSLLEVWRNSSCAKKRFLTQKGMSSQRLVQLITPAMFPVLGLHFSLSVFAVVASSSLGLSLCFVWLKMKLVFLCCQHLYLFGSFSLKLWSNSLPRWGNTRVGISGLLISSGNAPKKHCLCECEHRRTWPFRVWQKRDKSRHVWNADRSREKCTYLVRDV